MKSYLKKTYHKKGLVEWLNVKALSSSPSTAKKKKDTKKAWKPMYFITISQCMANVSVEK
jgi:hypothetical protein